MEMIPGLKIHFITCMTCALVEILDQNQFLNAKFYLQSKKHILYTKSTKFRHYCWGLDNSWLSCYDLVIFGQCKNHTKRVYQVYGVVAKD